MQAFCDQLCDKQTLQFGIAFTSRRFPRLADVNQVREVVADDQASCDVAYQEVQEWFTSHDLRCLRWAHAGEGVRPILRDKLMSLGFRESTFCVMRRVHCNEAPPPSRDIRIVPARAMRAAYRQILMEEPAESTAAALERAEAFQERLDDPQYDVFLALVNDRPVGRCALYQVGDIANVRDISVSPAHSFEGVGGALLGHAAALARRLLLRMVCSEIEANDGKGRTLFELAGFVEEGRRYEYDIVP